MARYRKNNKSKVKTLLIALLISILIAGIAVGAFFLVKAIKEKDKHKHTFALDYNRYTHYEICSCGEKRNESAHTATEACEKCAFHITQGFFFNSVEGGYEIINWSGITDERVYIPETHDGLPVVAIADSSCAGINTATLIDIPVSVKRIERNAFKNCNAVVELVVPFLGRTAEVSSVTEENSLSWIIHDQIKRLTVLGGTIEDYALHSYAKLESVIIKPAIEYIGAYAFQNCVALTEIELSDATKITTIKPYAFHKCGKFDLDLSRFTALTEISESTFSGSGITKVILPNCCKTIGYAAFRGCYLLNEVVLPIEMDKIDYAAFAQCKTLTQFTFPQTLRYIRSGILDECTSLENIYMPKAIDEILSSGLFVNLSEEGVIPSVHITGTIDDYYKMSSVLISSEHNLFFNGEKVTEIVVNSNIESGRTFMPACLSLESVVIGDGVTEIANVDAFYGCVNLKKLTIPESLTKIHEECFNEIIFEEVNYLGTIKSWCENADDLLKPVSYYKDPNSYYPQEVFPKILFNGNEVTKITIPEGTEKIEEYAFKGFDKLSEIIIDDSLTYDADKFVGETSNVLDRVECPTSFAQYMLGRTTVFTHADTPEILRLRVYQEYNVRKLIICEGVTKIKYIAKFDEYGGSGFLEEVSLPSTLKEIDSSFVQCDHLVKFNLPSEVTTIKKSFHSCVGLNFSLPQTLTTIQNSFINMPLSQVTVPSGCAITDSFSNCANLVKIVLNEGVTVSCSNRYFCEGSTNLMEICDDTALFDAKWYTSANASYYPNLKNIYSSTSGTAIVNATDKGVLYIPAGEIYEVIGLLSAVDKLECDYISGKSFTLSEKFAKMKNAFITEISLGDGCLSLQVNSFYRWYALQKAYLGKNITSKIEECFDECPLLSKIEVSSENATYASDQNILFNKDKTGIIFVPPALSGDITLPNSLNSIGMRTFEGTNITSINVGNGVSSISDMAFAKCPYLKTVTFGASVNSIHCSCLYESNAVETVNFAFSSGWTHYGGSEIKQEQIKDSSFMIALLKNNVYGYINFRIVRS